MNDKKQGAKTPAGEDPIFDRVVSILDEARGHVVRAVNSNMVWAYWLIGREIVQELLGVEGRAEYGKQLIKELSKRLTETYGKGFSVTSLKYFRTFYQVYADRFQGMGRPVGDPSMNGEKGRPPGDLLESEKLHPLGGEAKEEQIQYPAGTELSDSTNPSPMGRDLATTQIVRPRGAESVQGFSPQLSWSHYRMLMRVDNIDARNFYEREAIEGGWSKRTLERQVHTHYYDRSLHAQQPEQMIAEGRQLETLPQAPDEVLKNPYVLEFLGYPNFAEVHESDVEQAIITHLQRFLLELGTGFAFVARQKHIRIEEDDRFIDLVFYHCKLKFYLLIDLKIEKLTHGDVGQMDGYVRMYDGLFTAPDDNPTIGLILCTEKCDTVARYSVLNDRKQIFASKYLPHLPSEEQLQFEIERERRLIEASYKQKEDENES